MTPTEIKAKVDRFKELADQQSKIKEEMELLKADFEKQSEVELEDTKNKTVEYWGSSNAKIIVQNASTVKPVAMTVLKELLGKLYDEFVKEETKFTLNNPCKIFLSNMFDGNYIEGNISDVVRQITDDPKTQKTLAKRLKGKYELDKKNIMKLVGMDELEASDWAYMVSEVFAYQTIVQIVNATDFKGTLEDAVAKVKSAIIVDKTIKVALQVEK